MRINNIKRKALVSGVALVAAAALVGAGTYALYTSTVSTPGQSVEAGTLDLEFANNGLSNSVVSFPYAVENAKPGESGSGKFVTVKNTGSLPAVVAVKIRKISDNDNGCNATELAADTTCGDPGAGDGELDANMDVTVNGWTGAGTVLNGLAIGESALVSDLGGTEWDSTFLLAAGATSDQRSVSWSIPSATGNIIQSDSASFEIVFEATQVTP